MGSIRRRWSRSSPTAPSRVRSRRSGRAKQGAPWSGTVSDRSGPRLPATLGMALLAAGLLLLSCLGPASPLGYVALALAVVGLGTGLFTSPNNSALMGAARELEAAPGFTTHGAIPAGFISAKDERLPRDSRGPRVIPRTS